MQDKDSRGEIRASKGGDIISVVGITQGSGWLCFKEAERRVHVFAVVCEDAGARVAWEMVVDCGEGQSGRCGCWNRSGSEELLVMVCGYIDERIWLIDSLINRFIDFWLIDWFIDICFDLKVRTKNMLSSKNINTPINHQLPTTHPQASITPPLHP